MFVASQLAENLPLLFLDIPLFITTFTTSGGIRRGVYDAHILRIIWCAMLVSDNLTNVFKLMLENQ